jgi:hypothetical protein
MLTQQQTDAWLEHPVVRHAIGRAGDGATLTDVLFALHEVLDQFDTRFPGIPIRDILSAPQVADRAALAKRLKTAGVSSEDVSLITGQADGQDQIGEVEFQIAYDDVPASEIVAVYNRKKTQAEHIRSLRQPISDLEQEVIDVWPTVMNKAEAARLVGCSIGSVRKALRKHAWRQWVLERYGEEV